jgi:hypothetical protein
MGQPPWRVINADRIFHVRILINSSTEKHKTTP